MLKLQASFVYLLFKLQNSRSWSNACANNMFVSLYPQATNEQTQLSVSFEEVYNTIVDPSAATSITVLCNSKVQPRIFLGSYLCAEYILIWEKYKYIWRFGQNIIQHRHFLCEFFSPTVKCRDKDTIVLVSYTCSLKEQMTFVHKTKPF